jgi:osmotically inducible protein OsmC
MKKLFTSEVVSKGARSGTVRSTDGTVDTQLGNPLDPKAPAGPNPETFFAAAYSACFHGALQNAAKKHGTPLKDSTLTARVSLNEDDNEGYFLSVEILAQLPGVDRTQAEKILATAHQSCPYSKLSRGESKVEVRLA